MPRSTRKRAVRSDKAEKKPPADESKKASPEPEQHHDHKTSKHKRHHRSRKGSFWTSGRFLFGIGSLLGIFAGATYFVHHEQILGSGTDVSLEWLWNHKNLLPAGIWSDFMNMTAEDKLSDSFAVGLNLKKEGLTPKHPVVMVPGVISTSLESWGLNGTKECPSRANYRKPLWGGWYMIKTMLTDKNCWLQHIMLDKETGLDPPFFKIRPTQGLEAADFFITGYWIWNKIIENLSAVGYDPNNMFLAAYDWRLGYPDLEVRDNFFSTLRDLIERNYNFYGEKSVIMGHSMGSQVVFYFFKWVETKGYGDRDKGWCDKYIEAFVDISGTLLGTPKDVTALISGEMKDTIALNKMAIYGLEKFFARHERLDMLLTWPGLPSMLPKGGEAIWGNTTSAPDDTLEIKQKYGTYGKFIRFSNASSEFSAHNLTMDGAINYMLKYNPDHWSRRMEKMYSHGYAQTKAEVRKNENNPKKWVNPLDVALPNAPNMKVYGLYGYGKLTERAYTYKDSVKDVTTPLNVTMDFGREDVVIFGEGDGTVSLISHTILHKWKEPKNKLNPGGCPVTIVEMKHEPDSFDLRGGAKTAEHVDILGRTELNEMIVRIAAGYGHEIKDRITSNITEYLKKVDLGEH